MFTLKLYKRNGTQIVQKILSVDHVQVMSIGQNGRMLELWAFERKEPSEYYGFYIGEREEGMDAIGEDNHWGWGLLENAAGKTTEHFRPASYGI